MSKHRGGGEPAAPKPEGAPAAGLNGDVAGTPAAPVVPARLPAEGPNKPPDMRRLTDEQKAQAQAHLFKSENMQVRKRALELESEMLKLRQENLGLRAQIHNQASATADKARDEFLTSRGPDPKAEKGNLKDDMVVTEGGALKK